MSAWALLGVAGVAGLFFSLYRNDVLLGVARRGGWEPRYLAFEARMLGTPGWGTPRSLTTELRAATPDPTVVLAAVQAPMAEGAPRAAVAQAAQAAPVAAAPATPGSAPPAVASPARATSDGVKIVSLDALATLPTEQPSAPAPARAAVAAPARAAVAAPPPPVAKAPVAKAPVAKAPVAKAPVAKAPVAKAPPPAPARPAAPVAAAPPANENPLKAAIRTAIVKESQAK